MKKPSFKYSIQARFLVKVTEKTMMHKFEGEHLRQSNQEQAK